MIFLDANVLIDGFDPGSAHRRWSLGQFAAATGRGRRLVANIVVVAEVARRFASPDDLQEWIADFGLVVLPIDLTVAFRAATAFEAYRRAGGVRDAILADFLIGAHAATLGVPILTRDRGRLARYFPELTMITPETHK